VADPTDAFAQVTAAGNKIESYTVKAPYYRVVWAVGGTAPSFTFSVSEYAS
jgi:hypothetical protein